jgi:hypothetical protein
VFIYRCFVAYILLEILYEMRELEEEEETNQLLHRHVNMMRVQSQGRRGNGEVFWLSYIAAETMKLEFE